MNFDFFWDTYVSSFPPDERRSLDQQRHIMADARYHVYEVGAGAEPMGFIAYWAFDAFIFIEHYALSPATRGQGVGSGFLRDFISKQTKPIVLEVEPPKEEIQHRRVQFYERLGFHLSRYTHLQKAYVPGRNPVLLQLMSYPEPMDEKLFDVVENTLFSTIYKAED